MSKLPGRIPFEDVEKFRNWAVPKVNGQVLASAEREAKKAQLAGLPKQDHETIEDISAEQITIGPMTAERLAQMTEEASREGFNQGYDEGLEKGLAAGERQGFEQGKAQAQAEWNAQLKLQAEHLAASCDALLNPLAQQSQRLTSELLNLSVMLAEQLMQQALTQNPALYWHWVQEALAQLPSARQAATLYLPEAVVACLAEHKPAQWQNLSLAGDASLGLGAYRIEAGPSEIVFDAKARLSDWLNQVQAKPGLTPELKSFQPDELACDEGIEAILEEAEEAILEEAEEHDEVNEVIAEKAEEGNEAIVEESMKEMAEAENLTTPES
ncbi:MAG: hypothetical protein RL497_2396 [Pseudomonadota bacterium]